MMEVLRTESLFIYLAMFFLFTDFLFFLEGFLIPLALVFLFVYFITPYVNSVHYLTILVISMLFLMYFYKASRLSERLVSSTSGYVDTRIFHNIFMKLLGKLQSPERLYFKLKGQFGYVIRKFENEDGTEYRVKFNFGAFGRKIYPCYSDEELEWGDRVEVSSVKDEKIYVRKVKKAKSWNSFF